MGSAVGVTTVVGKDVNYWLIKQRQLFRNPDNATYSCYICGNDSHLYYHNDIHNDIQLLGFRNPDQQFSYSYIGYAVRQLRFRRHGAVYHFKYYNVNDYISFKLFWLVRPRNLCSKQINFKMCHLYDRSVNKTYMVYNIKHHS